MNPYCLIIIDMQDEFESSKHPALNTNISKQIRKSMEYGFPIVFVKYSGSGPVNHNLLNLVNNYDNKHFVTKDEDDGSPALRGFFRRTTFRSFFGKNPSVYSRNLVVCGVNTNCCVQETVLGLINGSIFPIRITVPVNCCNTDCGMWTPENANIEYYHSLEYMRRAKTNLFSEFSVNGITLV